MTNGQAIFPFPAIVGQEDLKLALLLNAVNPRVEGVLIRGEKGTAKSTAVRGLAALLPDIEVVKGCAFSLACDEAGHICLDCGLCDGEKDEIRRPVRVVTLPLNATEDRVVGGIDFERTISMGFHTILPGLLASAHRGILYVDEVNLLDDHLVDIILSVAGYGTNTIEREGVSFSHPARFILVGTMNPEEGELRPQFLDRFGLCVKVKAEKDPELRVQAMERREAFDADSTGFIRQFQEQIELFKERISRARTLLPRIIISGRLRLLIAEMCSQANVAGHRADLVMEQAARALAGLSDRAEVKEADILRVASLVMGHRQREAPPPPRQEQKKPHHQHQQKPKDAGPQEDHDHGREPRQGTKSYAGDGSKGASSGASPDQEKEPNEPVNPNALERVFEVGTTFRVRSISAPKDRVFRRGSGRRSRSRVSGLQGRYVKNTLPREIKDVALDATLRAAAPYQNQRHSNCAIAIEPQDIREKIRERRVGNFLLFVVDASGSMGARGRMTATKGAIMSLMLDAYQKRDKVAMICFSKAEARVALPPTSSIDMAARMLADLPVGGRTPLNAALVKTADTLGAQLVRDPTSRPIVVLITDGRCNVSIGGGKPMEECLELARRLGRDERVRFIVVDTEGGGLLRFGLARRIAEALNGTYFKTQELKADTLVELIKED